MVNDKILRDYVMKNDDKSEIFHTSGYAQAQSGANLGAAGGGDTASFAKRQALDAERQLVKNYRDTSLMQGAHNKDYKAKVYTGESTRGYGRINGEAKKGYGRNEGGFARGYGRTEGGPSRSNYGRTAGGSVGAGGVGAPSTTPPPRKVSGINVPR